MTVADEHQPHDVVELLELLMTGGAQLCVDQLHNVADFVWLGDEALRILDAEAARLAALALCNAPTGEFHHAAYVSPDGTLAVVGRTVDGAFVFRVPQGRWGWCRPLA